MTNTQINKTIKVYSRQVTSRNKIRTISNNTNVVPPILVTPGGIEYKPKFSGE